MSRGLGKVERAIIEALEKQISKDQPGCNSIPGLVASIYGQSMFATILHQPLSQEKGYQSIKRATLSLARKGLVERQSFSHDSRVRLVMCTPPRDTLKAVTP